MNALSYIYNMFSNLGRKNQPIMQPAAVSDSAVKVLHRQIREVEGLENKKIQKLANKIAKLCEKINLLSDNIRSKLLVIHEKKSGFSYSYRLLNNSVIKKITCFFHELRPSIPAEINHYRKEISSMEKNIANHMKKISQLQIEIQHDQFIVQAVSKICLS